MIPAGLSRTIHKWLALVVGAQALLWIVSGFYMVVVNLDFIHGDTLVRNLTTSPPRAESWFPLNALRTRIAGLEQLRIKGLPGFDQPLYEVRAAGRTLLIDGTNGQRLSPLGESRIIALARQYYAGRGSPATIELLVGEPPLEIQSRPLPLWRVQFDDWHQTTLYIHPDSGELVTRRHRLWRWFDALWMLHIMDYEERTDVNNVLLRAATIAGLVLAASGLWLLYFSFRRRRTRRANRS
ncbi:MAG TPA: hypothetical protein VML92_02540 [Steroidobacteraceae bacterium]|nr:hypothetical protein [Steroidobacteraceae bacterium]